MQRDSWGSIQNPIREGGSMQSRGCLEGGRQGRGQRIVMRCLFSCSQGFSLSLSFFLSDLGESTEAEGSTESVII